MEAFRTSAFSLKALAAGLLALLERGRGGGAVVGLDFDARVAWPAYDWAGVSKAALESVNRYLARDLGPRGVRSNLVAAGPLQTVAAGNIDGLRRAGRGVGAPGAARLGPRRTPGPWPTPACSCCRRSSRMVTGEILHVDGGYPRAWARRRALADWPVTAFATASIVLGALLVVGALLSGLARAQLPLADRALRRRRLPRSATERPGGASASTPGAALRRGPRACAR